VSLKVLRYGLCFLSTAEGASIAIRSYVPSFPGGIFEQLGDKCESSVLETYAECLMLRGWIEIRGLEG
jgi:hypothetical protein